MSTRSFAAAPHRPVRWSLALVSYPLFAALIDISSLTIGSLRFIALSARGSQLLGRYQE